MASPRSPTPSSRGATPELLTPRSKIKALLATVESSDDEDGNQIKTAKKTSPKKPPRRSTITQEESDQDSDSDVQIRPRGKLASRMQGITTTAKQPEPTNPAETARDRVKRMLEKEEAQAEPPAETDGADAEDEDDDELPVAPRRLKRRIAREATPEIAEPSNRAASPGLFVSSPARPSPSKNAGQSSSEEDLPAVKSDRFKALVERKRQERLAREAEEEARRAERLARHEKLASELGQLDSDDGNVSSITDDEGGLKLTQQARPTRKAGKKAIEEMNRETQRMQRSMQLAHEAKTRKKVTKASLFERFNYRPAGAALLPPEAPVNSSSKPGSPRSDTVKDKDTPPSSPPEGETKDNAQTEANADVHMDEAGDEDLPTLAGIMSSPPPKLDKGKALAVEPEETTKLALHPKRRVRVRLPIPSARLAKVDSDDELEITTTTKDKINAIFDRIPLKQGQESHSLQALRALALVKSPGKDPRRKKDQDGMTPGELQTYLQQKARQQAKVERDKRMELLKAQGAVIQTAEERERQMQEVEDILAKAREDDKKIMQEERAAAKKEREENGEVDPLAWDDSDDDEYEEGGNDADEEASEVELSGSEEEDGEEEEEEQGETAGAALFDAEADDAKSESSETTPSDAEAEAAEELPVMKRKRVRKQTTVLSDDEAEMTIEATPKSKTTTKITPGAPMSDPIAPTSVLRSAKKNFIPGLPVHGPAGLGLTQIFAGTMDTSQTSQNGPTQSMMPDFSQFPDSNFSATMDDVEDMVIDSQQAETQKETQGIKLNLTQTQMRGLDSLLRDDPHSQTSDLVEFTQDGGFEAHTPLRQRYVEPPFSTANTAATEQHEAIVPDSPLVRRGRLRRKVDIPSTDEQASTVISTDKDNAPAAAETAFGALKEGAKQEKKKQLVDDFNKKKSNAKEMVEEQAEESEDEYAGLGGADGEDSDNESDASVHEIIDDAAGNDADERKLAAFYADRERASDEKQVEKLYKDITSGLLRRKRGTDYDLSDSDDGGEARRRMKRRQFAKMQKALFADERVKKIAENPGNQAFLRTIEDRGSDDEMDFLDVVDAPESQSEESQSRENSAPQEQRLPQIIPDSQPKKASNVAVESRPPAHLRRTKDGKKPSNIGEVRETLSDLLDERHSSIIPATILGSDSEDEERPASARSNRESTSPNSRRNRNAVVDRISMKRNSSTTSNSNRLAFATAGASSSSFKVPALLRRATTNSSLISGSAASTSTTTSGTTGSSGGFGEEAKIKKGAGKKSGVHGFTRDTERRARMQETERRREEKKIKGAESRVGLVGGLLGKGSFE
ncbi:hypothetical protein PT974_11338 [Cladobotryum mycophilum]|uniref:DNA replication checkpoint mediator MRC1 domain-containing protein n=1 Tax=Cladobotryum mycophilum TaxID=491253 RepID=A0ABR0S5F1_9HYPO